MLTRIALRLGAVSIEIDRRRVWREGAEIHLRPKTFDLLARLAQSGGRLHTYEELQELIWPEVHVSRNSIAQCISEIRRALGPGIVKTVSGRGVRIEANAIANGPHQPELEREPAQAQGSLVLAFPFRVDPNGLPPGTDAERLFESLVDELAVQWRVVAPELARLLARDTDDPRDLYEGLGVAFSIRGAIERDGDECWIRARVVDTRSREIVGTIQMHSGWVRREMPGLRSNLGVMLAQRVVQVLGPADARASGLVLDGGDPVRRLMLASPSVTHAQLRLLRARLDRLATLGDPFTVEAALAILGYHDYWSPPGDLFDDTVRRIDSAVQALPDAHVWRRVVLGSHNYLCAWSGRAELAGTLDPPADFREFPEEVAIYGFASLQHGEFERALAYLRLAYTVTPSHPHAAMLLVEIAHAEFLTGKLEEAYASAWKAAAYDSRQPRVFPCIAAIASELGRCEDARFALSRCRADAPFARVSERHAAGTQPTAGLYRRAAQSLGVNWN